MLSDEGSGADSGIIEAMEWAKAEGADVVSMSLGSSIPDDGSDPMSQAVDALSAEGGPLFVIAAGNAYGAGTIGSPGSAQKALTIAAVDKQDNRADFSSMGPLVRSYGLKPDLSAPGVDINAAASQSVPGIEGMYQSMSGTSMATPHVAGAAAILKQRHPDWSGQRIKDALMSSSKQLAQYTPYEQGTGRLDVKAAVDTTIEATGSVAVASYDWPHSPSDPVAERTITYRNTGAKDVTLDLATDTDADAYTLSAKQLTVPSKLHRRGRALAGPVEGREQHPVLRPGRRQGRGGHHRRPHRLRPEQGAGAVRPEAPAPRPGRQADGRRRRPRRPRRPPADAGPGVGRDHAPAPAGQLHRVDGRRHHAATARTPRPSPSSRPPRSSWTSRPRSPSTPPRPAR